MVLTKFDGDAKQTFGNSSGAKEKQSYFVLVVEKKSLSFVEDNINKLNILRQNEC